MKNRLAVSLLGLSLSLPITTFADTLGIYVGGGRVNYDVDGHFKDLSSDSPTTIDFQDDLGLDSDSGNYFYVAFEHPVPLLPNIKFSRSEIEESGSNTLDRSIEFDDVEFPAGTKLSTITDFTHNDFTFYYEILDNWVNLDLGLTARQFDGKLESVGSFMGFTDKASVDLDFVAPLLYGKVRFDLPLTGLYVSADGNWIGAGGANLYDLWARAGYTFAFGLGIEAGLRKTELELDDIDDLDAEVTLDGQYIAVTFHF